MWAAPLGASLAQSLYLHLFTDLCVFVSLCLSLCVCGGVSLSLCPSASLGLSVSVSLCLSLSVLWLSVHLLAPLSPPFCNSSLSLCVSLSLRLSISLSASLALCPGLSLPFSPLQCASSSGREHAPRRRAQTRLRPRRPGPARACAFKGRRRGAGSRCPALPAPPPDVPSSLPSPSTASLRRRLGRLRAPSAAPARPPARRPHGARGPRCTGPLGPSGSLPLPRPVLSPAARTRAFSAPSF